MVKRLLLCVVVVLALVSSACAATEVHGIYQNIADFMDGKPDYSNARFFKFSLALDEYQIQATEAHTKLTGTLTLQGGNYSFWNGKTLQKVSGTPQTFNLKAAMAVGEGLYFDVLVDSEKYADLLPENDKALNSVGVSWTFPEMPSLNGSGNLGTFLNTQEQLASFTPYFELISQDGKITGANWRIIKQGNTSEAITADFGFNGSVIVIKYGWNYFTGANIDWLDAGQILEGSVMFEEPVEESEIWAIQFVLNRFNDEGRKEYDWYFFNKTEPYIRQWTEPYVYLWRPHVSNASLVNGKSDYTRAVFAEVAAFIDVEDIVAEAKYFTTEGSITIPGGGYTVVDDHAIFWNSSKDILETVPAGTNKTFKLTMDSSSIGSTNAEYAARDDRGRAVAFSGGAETGLNGRTITWTFPDSPAMNGSDTLPNYKSTAEQLATGVPYIELVSADGKITAINYKIVTARNTSTAIMPSYRTDFLLRIFSEDGKRIANSGWQRERASGTWTLDSPVPLSQARRIFARLRSYEDPSNACVYQWNFYPPVSITTASLPSAATGTPYTAQLASNLSSGDVVWQLSSGTFPAGLILSENGRISGTPTTAGTYSFTVRANSGATSFGTRDFTITISETATVSITTATLPSGTAGTYYTAQLSSTPSGATWSVSSGMLPPGLNLEPWNAISGTPTTAGTYSFTLKATRGTATATRNFTITIASSTLTITTNTLPGGTVGEIYSARLTSDSTRLASWSVSSGTLPDGLILYSSDGGILGVPTKAGTFTFTVQAQNAYASATKSFTITIAAQPVSPDVTPWRSRESGGGCSTGLPLLSMALTAALFLTKKR